MANLRALLTGPPPALPPLLDRLAERWAASPPRGRWLVVAGAVVLALTLTGRGAIASPWGPPVEVVVAARPVPAGAAVTAADLTTAAWPRDLVTHAARTVADVVGQVAVTPLEPGAPVTWTSVGRGGLAAELAAGRAAVAVTDPAAAPLTVGWRVDVVAQRYDGTAGVVAAGARVLAFDGQTAWLDIARADAPAVAAASARGDATLVLLPPG